MKTTGSIHTTTYFTNVKTNSPEYQRNVLHPIFIGEILFSISSGTQRINLHQNKSLKAITSFLKKIIISTNI